MHLAYSPMIVRKKGKKGQVSQSAPHENAVCCFRIIKIKSTPDL